MAVTIDRTISDGAQAAVLEFVTTGNSAGDESGTIFSAGDLSGADGSGDERVRITRIVAIITNTDGNPAFGHMELEWGGAGDVFCTLGYGNTDISIPMEPTSGFTGDVTYTLAQNAAATLRIYVEKLHGFPASRAKFASGL